MWSRRLLAIVFSTPVHNLWPDNTFIRLVGVIFLAEFLHVVRVLSKHHMLPVNGPQNSILDSGFNVNLVPIEWKDAWKNSKSNTRIS